jgi:hypothetical protein
VLTMAARMRSVEPYLDSGEEGIWRMSDLLLVTPKDAASADHAGSGCQCYAGLSTVHDRPTRFNGESVSPAPCPMNKNIDLLRV